jgi:hypothetical protein
VTLWRLKKGIWDAGDERTPGRLKIVGQGCDSVRGTSPL